MKLFTTIFFLTFIPSLVRAELQTYQAPVLLARADIEDGYNLPAMSFLSNTSPVINNRGDVSFKLMAIAGENNQGLWLKKGSEDNGKIVYTAPDQRFITDPNINNLGKLTFNLYDEGVTDGIFSLDIDTLLINQVLIPQDNEIAYYTYPQMISSGKIYFRGTNQNNARAFYEFDHDLKTIIEEGTSHRGLKSSYLFKLNSNDEGDLSFKRRVGEVGEWDEKNGDEILYLKPISTGYETVVIARDRDLDSSSEYIGFLNSTSISQNGLISFIGVLANNNKTIALYDNGVLTNIATEKMDDILEIEMFSPKVNNMGIVLFRAKNTEGKRGLYIASREGVKRLIGEGDEVVTDLGIGKILSNPNYPGFGGEVDMNDNGDIVFYSLVVGAKDNKEWGSAIYKMSPQ